MKLMLEGIIINAIRFLEIPKLKPTSIAIKFQSYNQTLKLNI